MNRVTLERPVVVSPTPAEPAPAPGPSAPSGTPPEPRRKPFRWRAAVVALAALAAVLLLWVVAARRESPEPSVGAASRTATLTRGDFVRVVRIHGVVEAVESHAIAAPRLAGPGGGPMIITKLVAAGARVRRGDLLVELDRQNQIKAALDRQAEYRDLEEQIKKKAAEHSVAQARDETELKQAENDLQKARLEMRRNEVLSRIDAEKNQQNLEEAEARLRQLRDTLELKRVARRADLRILEIQHDRARNAMLHARRNADRMAIRAPLEGLVVLSTIWKGGQMGEVQEGDEVRPGAVFMHVVNPAAMQVRARVNQADFLALRVGQPVEVRLDAYPELLFPGRVEQLAAIGGTSGWSQKVRYFAGTFSIRGAHPNLLPDISAAVDIELERLNGMLRVPREAVEWDGGKAYLRVRNAASFERRAVQVRALSDLEAVIVPNPEQGVVEGAVVLRGEG